MISNLVVLLARAFQRVLTCELTPIWSMWYAEHYVARFTQLRSLPIGQESLEAAAGQI